MPNAENAILYYEAGRTAYGFTELTDQGDQLDFKSAVNLWSRRSGYLPNIKPNGLATGGIVGVAVSGSNDVVDVAALTCYLAGVLTSVGASADETITRATPTDTHKISSITVDSGGSIAVVAGTDGTSFSETRGAAGGPPYIPVGSIEIAQVRLSSNSAAAIDADEIFMVPNVHTEWYNFPTWDPEYSDIVNGVLGYAGVLFTSALNACHTGDVAKKVYASFYTPTFAEVPDSYDFVPPANSHSVNSTQVYGATRGSVSSTIGAGSFSSLMSDGITDAFLREIDQFLWFKFKQDRNNNPYILCQGKLGISQTFPAGADIAAACTIGAAAVANRVNG